MPLSISNFETKGKFSKRILFEIKFKFIIDFFAIKNYYEYKKSLVPLNEC